MSKLKNLALGLLMSLLSISGVKEEHSNHRIEAIGVIQIQGITTYQYGTHIISGHAIRSCIINLDD